MDQQQNYVFNLSFLFKEKYNKSHLWGSVVVYGLLQSALSRQGETLDGSMFKDLFIIPFVVYISNCYKLDANANYKLIGNSTKLFLRAPLHLFAFSSVRASVVNK